MGVDPTAPDWIALELAGGADASEWSLVAGGDVCLRPSTVGEASDGPSRAILSDDLTEIVAQADVSIANLEGPVHDDGFPITKAGPALTLDPSTPALLRQSGFSIVTLANNHIMDRGPEGLAHTVAACRSAGLSVCGAGESLDKAMLPVSMTVTEGVPVTVYSFCEHEFGIAGAGRPGSAWVSHPMALEQVAASAARGHTVIVCVHGGVEEVPFPPLPYRDLLRRFVDAGATLVIGQHPHVPQGWERYRQGMIFFSLGNLLFDYPGGARYRKTEWGLMIEVRFSGRTLRGIRLLPVERLGDGRAAPVGVIRDRQDCLAYLHRLNDLQAELLPAYWQELAVYLWESRYHSWVRKAVGVPQDGIRAHLVGLKMAIVRRARQLLGERATAPVALRDGPLLLNTIRCESHRWTIETALSVLEGCEPDLRSAETRMELAALLRWTQEDGSVA